MRNPKQPTRELFGGIQLRQILMRLQEHVLTEIHGIFAIRDQPQQVIEDTFLPPRHEEVVSFDVPSPRLSDQVAIFDLAKDQSRLLISGSVTKDGPRAEKVGRDA